MDDPEDPEHYFGVRGFEVQIEERDLHADLMAEDAPGQASFYRSGETYYSVTLLRSGKVVAARYADALTASEALARARQRFGSEQV